MRLNQADKLKILEIASERGFEFDQIQAIVMSPFEFIRSTIKEIDFKDGLTPEEFAEMKTNFNIPCIGKMYASNFLYNRIQKYKNASRKTD